MKIKNMASIFVVMLLLGLSVILLIQSNKERMPQQVPVNQQLIDVITKQESDIALLDESIANLRQQMDTELEQQSKGTSTINILNQSLQSARYFAGLSERSGKGVVLTLSDNVQGAQEDRLSDPERYDPNNYILHDKNLLYIVNALKGARPDGIAINNQRIVSNTNIRCVGTVILVNDNRLAPPYVISILGQEAAILNAIMSSREIEYLVNRNFPITYEIKDDLTLPAYNGSVDLRYATLFVEPIEEPVPEEEVIMDEDESAVDVSPAEPEPPAEPPKDTDDNSVVDAVYNIDNEDLTTPEPPTEEEVTEDGTDPTPPAQENTNEEGSSNE